EPERGEDRALRRGVLGRDEPGRTAALPGSDGADPRAARLAPRVPRPSRCGALLHLAERQRARHAPHVGGALPAHRAGRDAEPAHRRVERPAASRARRLVGLRLGGLLAGTLRAPDGRLGSGAPEHGGRHRAPAAPRSIGRVKVLLVSLYFPPAGGGGVQRPLKFATHLPALGIETHVLAPDDPKWIHRDDELAPPTQAWVHRARYIGPSGRKPAEELHGREGLDLLVRRA